MSKYGEHRALHEGMAKVSRVVNEAHLEARRVCSMCSGEAVLTTVMGLILARCPHCQGKGVEPLAGRTEVSER